MAAKAAPKPKILKVVRTDSFVEITQEVSRVSEQKAEPKPGAKATDKPTMKEVTSFEELRAKTHEAPLPAFDEALQALGSVVGTIMGAGADWGQTGVEVTGVAMSYTEHGIRSAQILFTKSLLKGESTHPLKTPMFQIDDGKTTDQGKRQCAPKHAEAIVDFLKEAQRYALGERSQQLLDYETDEEEEEDDNIEQLPGMKSAPDATDSGE